MKQCPKCNGNIYKIGDTIVCHDCGWVDTQVKLKKFKKKLIDKMNVFGTSSAGFQLYLYEFLLRFYDHGYMQKM